jgi:pyrroline-5-carboxylate reductase
VSRILLVGCGKMGSALLEGWLERGQDPAGILVVEPSGATSAKNVRIVPDAASVPADFAPDIVVLAVKPQVMDKVLPAHRRHAGRAAFLSIAAGKTIRSFEEILGAETAIVRAMPNTPAAVGRGITVACPNGKVSADQRTACAALLEAVGEVAWIEDEVLMDAVTAVSGSGPAYVFLLAECLAAAGEKAGLPAELARRLARATVAGSGELLHQSAEDAATLRQNVTSPGGTTFAALQVLMRDQDGMTALLDEAVAAATRRSRELAG